MVWGFASCPHFGSKLCQRRTDGSGAGAERKQHLPLSGAEGPWLCVGHLPLGIEGSLVCPSWGQGGGFVSAGVFERAFGWQRQQQTSLTTALHLFFCQF